MAEKKRSSFILLLEHVHTMEELTNEEFGQFVRAYATYVETGTDPEFTDRSMRMMWKTVKAFDEMNCKKFEDTSEKRREAARKGNEKRWHSDNGHHKNHNCEICDNPIANDSKNRLSESVSESVSVSESSSKDDSSYTATTTSPVEFFRKNIGKLNRTAEKELTGYIEHMGADLVREIIGKCADLGGGSWAYVRKALDEAQAQGCQSAEEYHKTNPIGAGRSRRVDRSTPSGNDFLKDAARRRPLKKKGELAP
nr:MAG TPA: DnaD domain protein [Caudoviricetes sp.]